MRRTAIAPVSKAERKFIQAWKKVRAEVLDEATECAGLRAWPHVECSGRPEVHHVMPRTANPQGRLDKQWLVAICSEHHRLVDNNPDYAAEHGLHMRSWERDDGHCGLGREQG